MWGTVKYILCSLCVFVAQSKVVSTLPVTEDQEKLLTEALTLVKRNSFEMKTCLVYTTPVVSSLSNTSSSDSFSSNFVAARELKVPSNGLVRSIQLEYIGQ